MAVDGSRPAGTALQWAATLASGSSSTAVSVHVVAVAPPAQVLAPASEWGAVATMAAQYVRDAETVLADALETLRAAGVRGTAHLERGTPTARIRSLASRLKADLLCVGSHSRGPSGALRLGSVADALRHQVKSSVLVARGPPPARRILAATDGSARARRAVAAALALGHALAAQVTLLHAVDLPVFGVRSRSLRLDAALRSAVERRMRAEDPSGKAELAVTEGPAAQAMVAEAKRLKAGLVVLGSRGRGGLRSLVLGSVSNRVSRDAPCTVLVVKG